MRTTIQTVGRDTRLDHTHLGKEEVTATAEIRVANGRADVRLALTASDGPTPNPAISVQKP